MRIDDATDITDPVIWITESIYIQFNVEYVIVFRSRITGLAAYDASFKIDDIMSKLKQAVEEGKDV